MPDSATIQRIAKLLARATSPEAAEAQAALEGAFKRMKRDGVSFDDLLTLPVEALYQDVMIKLVDLILADQVNLSPSSKREAYAAYLVLIVAKFSGEREGHRAGQGSGTHSSQADDREAAARAYEERRRSEEAGRERERAQKERHQSFGGSPSPNSNDTQDGAKKTDWAWKQWVFSFSPARFFESMQPVYGRGSVLNCLLHDPVRCARLLLASLLWGMGFAAALILVAAVAHAVTNTWPIWDVQLKNLFAGLTALGAFWKAGLFQRSGYFR